MGREIVYCCRCSTRLTSEDFDKGKAVRLGNRVACGKCALDLMPAAPRKPKPPVRPAARTKNIPVPGPTPTSAPRSLARSRKLLFISGAAALASVLVVACILLFGGGEDPSPEASRDVPRAPRVDPALRLIRELETLASSSASPAEILRRCESAGKTLAPTSYADRLRAIETRARERKTEDERNAKLDALLASARLMRESDPDGSRREALLAIYETALEIAGPRKDEVERLREIYEREFPEVAKAAPPPTPPLPEPPEPKPGPPKNQPPAVSIKSPKDGATYKAPAVIVITAEASDPDGKIARVEFLLGQDKLGEVTEPPFSFTWRDAAEPGAYELITRAVDDAGGETLSSAVSVKVTKPPTRIPFSGSPIAVPGTIQAEDFDQGDDGVAYHDLDADNSGGAYRRAGVDIEPTRDTEGVFDVTAARAGEWLEYTITVAAPGTYVIEARVASKGPGGTFHIEVAGLDKTGPLSVPDTRGEQKWMSIKKRDVVLAEGEQLLRLVLEELDRVTHQKDIYKCAQFLVDNQASNGQWGYGKTTTYLEKLTVTRAKRVATPSRRKRTSTRPDPGAPPPPRVKPPLKYNIRVKPRRTGPDHGDNSNSQYAALGMRACHDGGIVFPKELLVLAREWWRKSQGPEDKKKNKPDVPTGAAAGSPRGWAYLSDGKVPSLTYYHSTGSMTAGAVGAICIYDHVLGVDWKRERAVRDGLAWMLAHFSVTGNPTEEKGVTKPTWHYYYLYALERAGMLYPTRTIGRHDWYGEGAKHLVDAQGADGSWNQSIYHSSGKAPTVDTCYAILFLRRATIPLVPVASVDRTR